MNQPATPLTEDEVALIRKFSESECRTATKIYGVESVSVEQMKAVQFLMLHGFIHVCVRMPGLGNMKGESTLKLTRAGALALAAYEKKNGHACPIRRWFARKPVKSCETCRHLDIVANLFPNNPPLRHCRSEDAHFHFADTERAALFESRCGPSGRLHEPKAAK